MNKKKTIILIVVMLLIIGVISVVGLKKFNRKEVDINSGVTIINEIKGSYIASKDINGYYPMILINEDDMKINLTTTQYLVGTYKQTEDGLITFTLTENASNFENKEVSNLIFEEKNSTLIAMKSVGSLILEDTVFEK